MPARGAEAFIDSNVLLYLLSGDSAKADVAESLLEAGGHVSVQVLNEVANVARRKGKLSWREIGGILGVIREVCTVHPLTVAMHDVAVGLAARHRLAVYDASIVASALAADCKLLWSEDLQHGRVFERRLEVRNPFWAIRR